MKVIKKIKGSSLPISLFVLLGVVLASIMLIKSGDTSTDVMSSISMKSQTTASSDEGIKIALDWLEANKDNLNNDSAVDGYFSSSPASEEEFFNDNFWLDSSKKIGANSLGVNSEYKIFRMCSLSNTEINGVVDGVINSCMTEAQESLTQGNTSSSGYGSFEYFQTNIENKILYMIVVRSTGLKDTKTITQTIISL